MPQLPKSPAPKHPPARPSSEPLSARLQLRRTAAFLATALAAGLALPTTALAQRAYPPEMPGTERHVYRTVGDVELALWICRPTEPTAGHASGRPAIVFFFGGGWRNGSPAQFLPHCRHLASRGMIAAAADYRVASRHGVLVPACVEDAKAAVQWLRRNAKTLGIDPQRIAAGGGSAGGHLAAGTALLPEHNPPGDPRDWQPNALALFNPAVLLAPVPDDPELQASMGWGPERATRLEARVGAPLESVSPLHHLGPHLPPTIIFHGTADVTVPHASVEAFTRKARAAGADCTLESYEGEGHGFFNHGRGDAYTSTVAQLDAFFDRLGWTKP